MGRIEELENRVFDFMDRLANVDPKMQYLSSAATALLVLGVLTAEAPWMVKMKGDVCWSFESPGTSDSDNIRSGGGKWITCQIGQVRAQMFRFDPQWETRSIRFGKLQAAISIFGPQSGMHKNTGPWPQISLSGFDGSSMHVIQIP